MKKSKPSLVSVLIVKNTPEGPKTLFIRRLGKILFGCWQYVTGKIESEETAIDAAFRELFEETHLIPSRMYLGDFLEIFYDDRADTIEYAPLFVAFIDDDQKVALQPKEHDEFEWISFNEAINRSIYTNQKEVIHHAKKNFVENDPSERLRLSLRRFRAPILETERLNLYSVKEDDINDYYHLLSDPKVMKYSLSGQKSFLEVKNFISNAERFDFCSIVLKKTGQFIGYLRMIPVSVNNDTYLEFEYKICHSFWNENYGTEAAKVFLPFLREKIDDPIFSSIEKENLLSIKVAESLGGVFDREIHHQDKLFKRYRYI